MDGQVLHEVDGVRIHDLDTDSPHVTFTKDGSEQRIDCDFVAGCDGFHGVSRKAIDPAVLREFERVYRVWLARCPVGRHRPVSEELIYASHQRGFALCSMRNRNLSRYYLQVPLQDSIEQWPDDTFWDELKRRIPGCRGRVDCHRGIDREIYRAITLLCR